MSAKIDTAQAIRFYYGNAARDLAHLLPTDEYEAPTTNVEQLMTLVDQVQSQLGTLEETRREIGFLLSDLKRLIPN